MKTEELIHFWNKSIMFLINCFLVKAVKPQYWKVKLVAAIRRSWPLKKFICLGKLKHIPSIHTQLHSLNTKPTQRHMFLPSLYIRSFFFISYQQQPLYSVIFLLKTRLHICVWSNLCPQNLLLIHRKQSTSLSSFEMVKRRHNSIKQPDCGSTPTEQSPFPKSLQHNSIPYHCRPGQLGRNLTVMKGWQDGKQRVLHQLHEMKAAFYMYINIL